ncbi:hypothetical protein SAMN02745181_1388 [Rubritalea squalenifaciens DSM 18772]|uniref:Lipoprotein n=1 Tax=Rubritalea squalenifaciens DSM 18772 TaxID=1123071 RepID=A0A1M6H7J8_9BACT|nr:hypothetical protein [Rubritalea squalenifaciens]SHJ18172.1 hypothetical protein SAMN02745181_1388 [Rubritalea squalenifaciens DSM 18772]
MYRVALLIIIPLALISCNQKDEPELPKPESTPAESNTAHTNKKTQQPSGPSYVYGASASPAKLMEQRFIKDYVPLSPPDSTDLQKLALTLPLYESPPKELVRWVTEQNGATLKGDEWIYYSDAAGRPVRVLRLPSSPSGAQRIRATYGTAETSEEWIYDLERTTGGWKLLNKGYKRL